VYASANVPPNVLPCGTKAEIQRFQYYEDKNDGKLRPGKKGIALSPEIVCRCRHAHDRAFAEAPITAQWETLKSSMVEVRWIYPFKTSRTGSERTLRSMLK
jgi:Transcriptional Coactivator p15 (PC4)